MPRLGQINDSPTPTARRRGPAIAFSRTPKVNTRNVALVMIVIFILRNILRNDYRGEEMKYLKESGMSEEEISRFVPKTPEERQKYVEDKKNDMERMKKDIAYLLQEVSELKAQLGSHGNPGGRDAGLIEMDRIHLEKRKLREEELLKNHPDFKPGNRLSKTKL